MLYLSQDPLEYRVINGGSPLTKIGTTSAYDNSITANATYSVRKRAKVQWKVRLNNKKVELAAERGENKMLTSTFDYTYTNRLKYSINLHAGVTHV